MLSFRIMIWENKLGTLSDYGMENKVGYVIRLWYLKIWWTSLSDYGMGKKD